MPGDTFSGLNVSSSFSHINADLCLLPIYLWSYCYRDKLYRFMVNGQTGRAAGHKPLSGKRITALVVFILIVIAAIALVLHFAGGVPMTSTRVKSSHQVFTEAMSDLLQKCEVCGGLLDEEDLFCSTCGKSVPEQHQSSAPRNTFATHQFECPGCGASMSYDATAKNLRCPFCGSERIEAQRCQSAES